MQSVVLPNWTPCRDTEVDDTFTIERCDEDMVRIRQQPADVDLTIKETLLTAELKRRCHLDLATKAPKLVFVHSGVVLTEHGLVVFPAKSYSGKSTLVRSLIDRGGLFYSDEYAVVDGEGKVRPFPRSHSERLSGGETRLTPAEELGWTEDLGPVPVQTILVTKYGADKIWEPQSLSKGQAVVKLLENTVSARTDPQKAITYLSKLVEAAECIETPRPESKEAADLLLEWMAKSCHPVK